MYHMYGTMVPIPWVVACLQKRTSRNQMNGLPNMPEFIRRPHNTALTSEPHAYIHPEMATCSPPLVRPLITLVTGHHIMRLCKQSL